MVANNLSLGVVVLPISDIFITNRSVMRQGITSDGKTDT
jgi:hypothetical protein